MNIVSYDYITLYDSESEIGTYGGNSRSIEAISITGNYLKLKFETDYSASNFYGYKAIIIPNY